MTKSQETALALYKALRDCGYDHMVGVPDRETAALWNLFVQDKETTVVTACREGEAVGICAGLYLGGRKALLCIKNFGFFESLDTLRVLGVDMRVPMLMFLGYAGRPRPGMAEELRSRLGVGASQVTLAGEWTESILRAVSIPYYVLDAPEDAARAYDASRQAERESRPVALLGELP